jgi:hypothetical protein
VASHADRAFEPALGHSFDRFPANHQSWFVSVLVRVLSQRLGVSRELAALPSGPTIGVGTQRFSARFQKLALPFSPAALNWIETYPWPGNVRELENVVCQAFLLASAPEITISADPADGCMHEANIDPSNYRCAKQRAILEFERRFLSRVIRSTDGNVSKAARLIQTERRHLGRLLRKYGLEPTAATTTDKDVR